MRIPLRLFALLALTAAPLATQAQTQPPVDVIFDHFTYANRDALLSPVQWTLLNGSPAVSPANPTGEPERAWYAGNWLDQGADTGSRIHHITVDGITHLRLRSFEGETYDWLGNTAAGIPPEVGSAFMAQTGTWVARVRLQDLQFGTDTTFTAQSFWTISPYYANDTAAWKHRYWSEIDHEWNNFFCPPQFGPNCNQDTGEPAAQSIMMSNGHTVDGVNGALQGGIWMRDTALSGSTDHTCYRQQGSTVTHLGDVACAEAFISDFHSGGWNRFVNLMIRYDGSVMTYAANMWDYAYPGGAALYYMERQVPVGRRFQPMTTRFSQIVPELGWCADPENPHPATACTVTQDMDLYVDWFLYTPATNISIWDAESYAWWMDVNGLNNVNTTGLQLAAPTTVDTQEVVLQSPATAPTGGVREWIVFPPTHSIELNAGVMYHVEWSTRRKLTSNGAFSNWSPWEDGGFTYEPSPWDVYLREVRVRVSYWYTFQGTEVMEDCMGLVNGITETSCEGESGIERGTGADTDVPLVFGLAQNEPNPAGGPTHIAFTLPDATTARLTVYDVTGREVAVLVDGEMASGHHEVVLDTDALPAGVYAYVLRTPTDHAVRRLTIR